MINNNNINNNPYTPVGIPTTAQTFDADTYKDLLNSIPQYIPKEQQQPYLMPALSVPEIPTYTSPYAQMLNNVQNTGGSGWGMSDAEFQQTMQNIMKNNAANQRKGFDRAKDVSLSGLGYNALQNVKEMGTGLVGMAAHPVKNLLQPIAQETKDLIGTKYRSQIDYLKGKKKNISLTDMVKDELNYQQKMGKDAFNFLLGTYTTTDDLEKVASGQMSKKDLADQIATNIYQNPVSFGLDVLTLGNPAMKAVSKTAGNAARAGKLGATVQKGIQKLDNIKETSKAVENIINAKTAEVKSKTYPIIDQAKELQMYAKKHEGDIPKAIEALETNKILPEGSAKETTKKLSKLVDAWDNAVPEYARVDKKELALSQKLVREGTANTIVEAQKIVKPYLEEGVDLAELANKGDKVAKALAEGSEAFDKGYLKLVPHGLAEIEKTGVGQALVDDLENRLFAGKYSQRVWGNAAYEDIAKQITNPYEWIEAQTKQWIDEGIVRELNEGKLAGQPLVNENTQKVKYIEPVTGEGTQVTLKQVLDKASDAPITPNSIPIDANLVKELNNQMRTMRGAIFSNQFANDLFQISKTNMLASGGYLAGNFQTGLANALMNNGMNPVSLAQNVMDAFRTKGKLAKEAGIYRNTVSQIQNKVKTPVIKQINAKANAPISNAFNTIDARVQNLFSEMALHKNLAKQGIKVEQRVDELRNMDKMKLAEAIHDAKAVSLINPSKTLLPVALHNVASLSNPFWRWMDTAAQSSIHMLSKEPLLSNIVLNHVATRIGFDKEMQNRLGLGVTSDKAFVSYRYNPQTKNVEEVSCEFTPQLNTMKLIGDMGDAVAKGDYTKVAATFGTNAVPFFGAVGSALMGKNRFGKPLVRPEMDRDIKDDLKFVQGDKRYEYRDGEGYVEKKGGYADEVLHAAVNEVLAPFKLYNRVIGPTIAGVTGQRYYKPYANQFTGEVAPLGEMPEHANPRSSAGMQNVIDYLTGQYSTFYNPLTNVQRPNASLPKQLIRGQGRRMNLNEMLIDQYGGSN